MVYRIAGDMDVRRRFVGQYCLAIVRVADGETVTILFDDSIK